MQQADTEAFREAMQGVYSFYGKDISTFAVGVWWQALKSYELIAIQDALGRHCINPDNGQFLPRPADVVRMIEGSTLDAAGQAWTKIDYAVQAVGTYNTVVFDDPLIHRVIEDMGGWTPLGRKTTDEWPFTAKEFQTRYRGYKSRRERPDYPPRLLGIIDGENQKHGLESTPTLIGNPVLAMAVLRGGSGEPRIAITAGAEAQKLIQQKDIAA